MTLLMLPLWIFFSITTPAKSDCACLCVDGVVQGVCSSSADVRPVCHPRVCPVQGPSIRPPQVDPVPPPNSSECSLQQVYDEFDDVYEWKNICE